MELLVTMINGFHLLINVTMNYILDLVGSCIWNCHNIPINQTLKQWMSQKTSFLSAFYKLHRMLFLLNSCRSSLSFRYQSREFEIKPMNWFLHNTELNGSLQNELSKMNWSLLVYMTCSEMFFNQLTCWLSSTNLMQLELCWAILHMAVYLAVMI